MVRMKWFTLAKVRKFLTFAVIAAFVWFLILPYIPIINLLIPRSYPGYDELISAIERKDSVGVKRCLANGIDPDWFPSDQYALQREDDWAPLNMAAMGGDTETIKALLDGGANPNIVDGWFGSPLEAAYQSGSLKTMALLIDRGTMDSSRPMSPLNQATIEGNWKVVNLIQKRQAKSATTP